MNESIGRPQQGNFCATDDHRARPGSSNLNRTSGRTVAKLVTVPVGADGKVEIANLGWGSAHVVVDLFGHLD
ncbi:hypothetical protein [Streptomyces yangpuensis]|uniref:hypothetical protein n=1 Tax=Streptomyces yangpuensis TaxID=1648182 RepID=UPI000629A599|nr:hypothetical protein [Streptomyces yangpuensis]